MTSTELLQVVNEYVSRFPAEASDVELLRRQLEEGESLNDRQNFRGHITGSAIILSPDRKQVLLIYHKLFDRWQQPGGHWETDAEASPLAAARREAEEETGIILGKYLPLDPQNPEIPLDIDTHAVPARPYKGEPKHMHHDWRFAFVAKTTELTHQEEEVSAAAWFPLTAPETRMIPRPLAKLRELAWSR